MAGFLGEYPVTLDTKGRLKIPTALKKQLNPAIKGRFVVNRGFEKCLILYPFDEWEKITARVNKLNTFKKEHRDFTRIFYRGATELILDTADRILIPKQLIEFAGIKSDVMMAARNAVIDIWNYKTYDAQMKVDSDHFAELAEKVMGGQDQHNLMIRHEPVLLQESIEALNIKPDGIYVDVTYGGGGHAGEILKRLRKGKLVAFDQDADAVDRVEQPDKLILVHQNFKYLKRYLQHYNLIPVDGILADLGISSHQIDTPERGFSYRYDAVLDMRMDRSSKMTAKDVLKEYPEADLHHIFREYGEIENWRKLVRVIVTARANQKIETAGQLKSIIEPVLKGDTTKYLSRIFQALRIEVNKELEALEELLKQCSDVLKTGGRLVVIAYHSLEDRMVKNFIKAGNVKGELLKDVYGNYPVYYKTLNKKPITPSREEIKRNNRARSAKMRVAEKI